MSEEISDEDNVIELKRGFMQLLDEANAAITHYTAEEARGLLGREDILFVDLRDPREIQRDGDIDGAFHCPRGMLEFWIDPDSPYHKPPLGTGKMLLFYCASGWRSALAAKTVIDMGYDNVAHIKGGYTAWQKLR